MANKRAGLRILGTSLLVAFFAGTFMGCVSLPVPAATAIRPGDAVATAIYLTAESINSARPARLPTIDFPTEPTRAASAMLAPSLAPTGTPWTDPGMRLATIQVHAPGPMSKVVSPLQIELVAVAGASRKLDVDLFGDDWRLLGHSLLAVAGSPAGDPLSLSMRFEIRTPSENAFLQISTRDAQGRVESARTLPIVLSSVGTSQISPADSMIYERVILYHLEPGAVVAGGELKVQGQFMPYKRHPAIIELISDEGRELGLRVLTFVGSDWQAFNTTVPYKVREPTSARLYIRQADDTLGEQAYIYSQDITLNP